MSKTDGVIIECLDEALSFCGHDKDSFYLILEAKYGIKRPEVAEKFEQVHIALRETFGNKHFAIDRQIVKLLNNIVMAGKMRQLNEIEAHAKVTEVFMAEAEMGITSAYAHVNLSNYARHLISDAEEMRKTLHENKKKSQILNGWQS